MHRRPRRAAGPRRRRASRYAAWAAGRICWPRRGDLDGLRARADAGDKGAARRLAGQLAVRGNLDEAVTGTASPRPTSGDTVSARLLAQLLAERGDLEALRARTDSGDRARCPKRLAGLLAERGDLDEAAQILRAAADVRRPGRRLVAGRICWPDVATWTPCAPAPTPATSTPPSWPRCWPSTATWTGRRDTARLCPGRR